MKKNLFNPLAFMLLLLSSTCAFSQIAGLDSTFNGTGINQLSLSEQNFSVRIQYTSDSSIINCGNIAIGSGDILLAKINADGTSQTSFGQGGIVVWGTLAASENAKDIIVLPDNKMIVVGSSITGALSSALVVKFNNDGSIDSSFGISGIVKLPFTGDGVCANCVRLQSDGKIFVAGVSETGFAENAIAFRLLPNGDIDSTFGNQGMKSFPYYLGMGFNCMFALDSNKWLLGGFYDDSAMLFKMAENGDPDTIGLGTAQTNYMFLQSNADIVTGITKLGNNYYISGYANVHAVLYSLNENFQNNTAFGNSGYITLDPLNAGRFNDIKITPDSCIVSCGRGVGQQDALIYLLIAKYSLSGIPDTSFNSTGYAIIRPPGMTRPYASSILIKNDGKIIAGGGTAFISDTDLISLRFLNKLKKFNLSSAQFLENEEPRLNIFPNPCHQELIVSGISHEDSFIVIKDIHGKVWKTQYTRLFNSSVALDVSGLPSGSYIVETHQKEIESNSQIFIKH